MRFPRPMVRSACHQFIPLARSPPASMYVGMQCAMEIHSAAKLYVVQLRRAVGTGARSGEKSGLDATSCGSEASDSAAAAGSCMMRDYHRARDQARSSQMPKRPPKNRPLMRDIFDALKENPSADG